MRQQHYRFAHQVFMQKVLGDPAGWLARLQSEGGNALIQPWTEAGQGVGPDDMADPMGLDARPLEQGLDGMLITMPPPKDVTEAYFVAVVRAPDGGVRYFVAERTSGATDAKPLATWSEWRSGPGGVMRIRGQDLSSVSPAAFAAAIAGEVGAGARGAPGAPGAPGGAFGSMPAPQAGGGGAFDGVAEGLEGGASSGGASGGAFGAPSAPSGGAFGGAPASDGAYRAPPQLAGGGAFGAPAGGQPSGGAFGAPAAGQPSGGAFGTPAAGQPTGGAAFGGPKPKKKSAAGKLIGCGCLSVFAFFVLIGAVLLYLEEGVDLSAPGDEVKTVNVQPNVPFTFSYKWNGTNYAASDVWAVVDGTKDGGDFRLKGQIACTRYGKPRLRDINVPLTGSRYRVANREDRGQNFTAWFHIHDDYARSSSKPFQCGGMITADRGTISKVKLVVTQRQRPSDWIAF